MFHSTHMRLMHAIVYTTIANISNDPWEWIQGDHPSSQTVEKASFQCISVCAESTHSLISLISTVYNVFPSHICSLLECCIRVEVTDWVAFVSQK